MEQSVKKPRISRKKQAPEHTDEKTNSIIHSPNLKYQFLTYNMGPLIKQLRKEEFNQIINLLNSNSKIMDGEITGKSVNKILICVGDILSMADFLIKQAISEFEKQCESANLKGKQSNLYRVGSIKFINCKRYRTDLKQIKNYISYVSIAQNCKSSGDVRPKIIRIKNSTGNSVLNVIQIDQLQYILKNNNQDSLRQFISLFSNGKWKEQHHKYQKQIYVLIGKSFDLSIKQKIEKKIGPFYNINTILFKPCLIQQKVKIVNDYLNKIKQTRGIVLKIPQNLIEFIIKKLDEKKINDIFYLIEVVEKILSISQQNQQVIADIKRGHIAVIDISLGFLQHEAIKEMLVSSKVLLIQKLPFDSQLVLAIIYQELKINCQLLMQYQKLQDEFLKALNQMKNDYGLSSLTKTVEQLESYGLIQMRNKSLTKTLSKKDKLSCKTQVFSRYLDDIERVLSKVPLLSKYFS